MQCTLVQLLVTKLEHLEKEFHGLLVIFNTLCLFKINLEDQGAYWKERYCSTRKMYVLEYFIVVMDHGPGELTLLTESQKHVLNNKEWGSFHLPTLGLLR